MTTYKQTFSDPLRFIFVKHLNTFIDSLPQIFNKSPFYDASYQEWTVFMFAQ